MHSSTKPAGKRSRHQRSKRLVARKIAEGEVACRAMQEEIECLRREMERQCEQSKEGDAIKDVSAHECQCEVLRQTLSKNEHQQQILEGELRQKNSKLEESVCERGRLTKEIDGLRQELVRERGNCQQLNDATESQFEALRKQIAEREEQQKTLQEDLRQRNTQCDTMAQTINELQKSSEQKVCDQKSQCDSLKHKVAELEKHLQEKTSILESTLSEAETLRKEVFQNNEDSKDRAALQKKIDALDEELMKVCLEKSHVQAELTKAQGEVDMYKTALRAMKIAGAQNQHDMVEANGRVDIDDGSPSAGSISPPSGNTSPRGPAP
ncbi:hypothetical protein FOZ62_032403 [Perkinsus olseni]|uniref:Uncharacterized protein n=1 Tax=Perkinsus olseni TaxID=32597 RepID=A0A7J6RNN6_PEROL|nr:hypothetical protein FOZ62_032403 [Perkinsus olseni]